MGDKVIGDKYVTGQAGAVGPGAQATNVTFQNAPQTTKLDLEKLAEELRKLREEMQQLAKDSEHQDEMEKVTAAEDAAKNGDESRVIETLKTVGAWTLGVAEKVGVTVAVAAIKSAFGI